eukprot:1597023-Pleurochrysis_carterae.AAC.2
MIDNAVKARTRGQASPLEAKVRGLTSAAIQVPFACLAKLGRCLPNALQQVNSAFLKQDKYGAMSASRRSKYLGCSDHRIYQYTVRTDSRQYYH